MPHRGRQSADGADDGGPAVPMAWLYAEYIADELLRGGDLMPPTSFEFRAGRDALALTVFLSDTGGEPSGIRVVTQLETWLSLTAYDQPWQEWVEERLAGLAADAASGGAPPGPDLELARAAWRWLRETELLAPDLNAVPGGGPAAGEGEGPEVWTPAWRLGLPLGHLAMHLFQSPGKSGRALRSRCGTPGRSGVWARVTAEDETWGSRVELRVGDGTGPRTCRPVVVGHDGSEETAAGWSVPRHDARPATVRGGSALHPEQTARYEVRTADGERPVTLRPR